MDAGQSPGRGGHIEMGIPAAIVAFLAVAVLFQGGEAFPLWVRVTLAVSAILFAGVSVLSLATPHWPHVVLEEDAPEPDEPG